jgi:hypothetical protein
VFAPELATEGCGKSGGSIRLAVHFAVDEVLIFHHDGEFAIMGAKLGL